MKCSNCGNEIAEGQRFCINCGTPVPQIQGCDETTPDTAPVAEQTVEIEAEESTAPVVEQIAEPVVEHATEPAAEQNVESVEEPSVGPVAEMVAKPEENHTEAPAEPAAYSTAKSAEAIIASIPKDYKPLPVWQFLGFEVLFSIPIIGVIASLIFSLEASKNVNLINFARARFLWTVVETLITLVVFVMALVRFL